MTTFILNQTSVASINPKITIFAVHKTFMLLVWLNLVCIIMGRATEIFFMSGFEELPCHPFIMNEANSISGAGKASTASQRYGAHTVVKGR